MGNQVTKHIEINLETGETTERQLTNSEQAEKTAEAWNSVRSTRNMLLAQSDWTVLADSPTSTAAWKAYRQQLRDLPANTPDPLNVVWPTPPA
jgi:hypothetical protein